MLSHVVAGLAPVVAVTGSWPAAIIACLVLGFTIGALGALLGIGGGFLVTPLLHSGVGLSAPAAVATSTGQIPWMAASGVVHFAREKKIRYRLGLALLSTSVPSAQLAAHWVSRVGRSAHAVEPRLWGLTVADVALVGTFSLLIGSLGVYNLWRAARPAPARAPRAGATTHRSANTQAIAATAGVGVAFGASAALLGVGGGFLAVPFFVHICGLQPVEAVATSLFAMLVTSTLTTVHYVATGQIHLMISVLVGIGALGGAQLGARLAVGASGRQLIAGVGAFQLVAVIIYLAAKLSQGAGGHG